MLKLQHFKQVIGHLRERRFALFSLLLIVLGSLVGLSATQRVWLMHAAEIRHATRSVSQEPNDVSISTPGTRVEVEEIAIGPNGFEPAEITRPVGRFILVISIPGGSQDLTLRISNELGSRLNEVRIQQNQMRWADSLLLLPGRYTVTEANHPNWVCNIVIQ